LQARDSDHSDNCDLGTRVQVVPTFPLHFDRVGGQTIGRVEEAGEAAMEGLQQPSSAAVIVVVVCRICRGQVIKGDSIPRVRRQVVHVGSEVRIREPSRPSRIVMVDQLNWCPSAASIRFPFAIKQEEMALESKFPAVGRLGGPIVLPRRNPF